MQQFLTLFLALTVSAAAADWRKVPFAEWSDDTVLKVLTDSPWAKGSGADIEWTKRELRTLTYKDIAGADPNPNKNHGLGPLGGIGAPKPKLPVKADLLIRWPNALPLRHAKAVYRQRDEKLPPERLNGLIDDPAGAYVVEIFGVPSEVAHRGTATIELLVMGSAYLKTSSGRKLKPLRSAVTIQPETLKILIYFPNEEPLRKDDGEVEFFADLQLLKCKEKFKLGSMMYMGKLEL